MTFAKKSLGQHWLHDQAALNAMCDAAQIRTSDTVLEIGPGTGELTKVLLDRGASVVAVELDERLGQQLEQRFAGLPFTLNMLSILQFDFTGLPPGYKLVANIPYYLTNHLFRLLSESSNPPAVAALLVQKEVAERVVATPGSMSLLSVTAQFYWKAEAGLVVPARLFTPPPKVDSQILVLQRRAVPLFNVEVKEFFRIVKAGFSARRKKLRSSLAGGLRVNKQEIEALLGSAGISPDKRAQELSLDDWHKIYQAYVAQG